MYRRAADGPSTRSQRQGELFRAGIVAIAITEADHFTGDRTGHEDEIIGTKEKSDEYAYQRATVQLVGNAVPLVLMRGQFDEATHGRKSSKTCSTLRRVLFTSIRPNGPSSTAGMPWRCSASGLSYVVPKRMQTSEKSQAKRLLHGQDRYETDRKLPLDLASG